MGTRARILGLLGAIFGECLREQRFGAVGPRFLGNTSGSSVFWCHFGAIGQFVIWGHFRGRLVRNAIFGGRMGPKEAAVPGGSR